MYPYYRINVQENSQRRSIGLFSKSTVEVETWKLKQKPLCCL